MKIAFYGDSFIDQWRHVEVKANPECGGRVLTLGEVYAVHPGGAANAARTLQHFDVESIDFSPPPCQVKTRLMLDGQQIDRIDLTDKARPPDAMGRLGLIAQRNDLEAIVVSDYGRGAVNEQRLNFLLDYARKREIPAVIDSKRVFDIDYAGSVFKCNEREATHLGIEMTKESVGLFAVKLGGEMVVTRTEEPPVTSTSHRLDKLRFPALPFQSSGAGDSFAAFLAYGLTAGWDLLRASEWAYRAAAAAGFFPPFRQPVLPREVDCLEDPTRLKLLGNIADLRDWLAHRVTGSLCVTNGCFDLFHAGHAGNLDECRAQADQLLVLVNSDESVRRLKGDGRPISPLAQRMRVLASLSSVSAVADFNEDTPAEMFREITAALGRKLDVLAKGPDYSAATTAGIEHALRYHACKAQPGKRSSELMQGNRS